MSYYENLAKSLLADFRIHVVDKENDRAKILIGTALAQCCMVNDNYAVIVSPIKAKFLPHGGYWNLCEHICKDIDGATVYTDPYLHVVFDNNSQLVFKKITNEDDIHSISGMQANYIGVDAIDGADKDYIYSLYSRNRGPGGGGNILDVVSPPVVLSDSFVGKLIGWYLDGDGHPVEERLNHTMYFVPKHDGVMSNINKETLQDQSGLVHSFSAHFSIPDPTVRITIT